LFSSSHFFAFHYFVPLQKRKTLPCSLFFFPPLRCGTPPLRSLGQFSLNPQDANLGIGDLLLDEVLERLRISSELADALAQLLHCHLVFVKVEAEEGLVVDVALLLDIKLGRALGLELLRHGVGGALQLLKKAGLCMVSISINRREEGIDGRGEHTAIVR
jgi:hypothetical protein